MRQEYENRAVNLYKEQPEATLEHPKKFDTRRQASKYLNKYGKVYRAEKNIEPSTRRRVKP